MRNKHNIVVAAVAALVPLIALSGCGSNNNTSASSGVQNVTFWYSNSGPAVKAINQLVGEFNKKNHGKIRVKASYQGSYAGVQQKFTAAVQSKTTPSILQMNDISTGYMIDSKQTTPVYELAKGDKSFSEKDIPEVARKYYSDSKGLLSMPMAIGEPALFINKTIAQKSGLDVSNPPKTFDEVVEWANLIHKKTGVYGFSMNMVDSWILEQLTAASGVNLCTPDNGRGNKKVSGINVTNPLQLKVFKQIANMFHSGVGLNPGSNSGDMISSFTADKLGLVLTSSASYTILHPGNNPKNVIVAKFPKVGNSKKAGTPIGGNSLWIVSANHSKDEQKASYEFAKFMMSPHAQAVFSKASGNLFANMNAKNEKEGISALSDPNVKMFYNQLKDNPAYNESLGCRTGAFPSIRKQIISAFTESLNGKDMNDAMKSAQIRAAKDIATYNKAVAR